MNDQPKIPAPIRGRPPSGTVRVAILGTGKMGSALASRLSEAGYELVLWNRTRARAEALGLGRVFATAAAAARDADVVISSLTGPEAVLAAYLGPDGAVTPGTGRLFIEMSTAGPELAEELARAVAAAGARLVIAPIIGAPPAVRAGTATVLAGGSDDEVAAATPLLSRFGTVHRVDDASSAARLKLVANSMLADVILAAAELQVAGERSGLDPDDVLWVLERLVPGLAARRAGLVEGRHVPPMFALRDLRKDLALAFPALGGSDADLPLTETSMQLVGAAAAATPDLDISAVAGRYRLAADVGVLHAAPAGASRR
jgi:3-hydroxyisobutyrate dehydrogenase-like beta-hydroxyacid dehydrogenase